MYGFKTSINSKIYLSFDMFFINRLYFFNKNNNFRSFCFFHKRDEILLFSINVKRLKFLNSSLKYFMKFNISNLIPKNSLVKSFYSGVSFLNWFFYKNYKNTIYSSVNFLFIKQYKAKMKTFIKTCYNLVSLVKGLNKKILWWIKQFSNVSCFNDLSLFLDFYLHKLLWRWCKRFHPRRPNSWIFNRYWKNVSGRFKFFSTNTLTAKNLFLLSHNIIPVTRKVFPCSISIFELRDKSKFQYDLFRKFRGLFPGIYGVLFDIQRGICPFCNKVLIYFDLNYLCISYISISKLNDRKISKFFLVHRNCSSSLY